MRISRAAGVAVVLAVLAGGSGCRALKERQDMDRANKLFAAKNGAIVGPLKGTEGYFITKVEASREGHIPFEAARTELAEEKLRQEQAVTRAKAAAEAALAKANAAPTSTLKTIFPPPPRATM